MTTFGAQQIRRFLEAVDKRLSSPVRLVIIGGSAALLQHGAKSPTRDIDAFEGDPALLKDAASLAERDIGFAVPVARAAVADLPLNYEDRLERPMPKLRHLDVVVPERYDLVLSKLIRASQADLVVCKEIHTHTPLKLDELLQRYTDEMKHAIGRKADHDQNLIAAVEFIWDEATADRAQRLLQHRRTNAQEGADADRGTRSRRRKH